MDWFRHRHGLSTDPKLAFVGKVARLHRTTVVAFWCYLLERASSARVRGSIGVVDIDEAAFALDMEPDEIAALLSVLEARGLIAEGRIANWDKNQAEWDSSSERVRRFRERRRDGDETGETGCNVSPVSRNVTASTGNVARNSGNVARNSGNVARNEGNVARNGETLDREIDRERLLSPIPTLESESSTKESYPDLPPAGGGPASPVPPAKAKRNGSYRWPGTVVRLTAEHYDGWAVAYHALDLDANLRQLDDFLAGPEATERDRKQWFQLVSGALRKRHEAALAERKARAPVSRRITEGAGFVPPP